LATYTSTLPCCGSFSAPGRIIYTYLLAEVKVTRPKKPGLLMAHGFHYVVATMDCTP
jgi:hypothetical protein